MKTFINFSSCQIRFWIIACLLMSGAFLASAQERWSVEFRPGVNFATQKLAGADLNTGYGAEATFAYQFMPHLAVYAGWGWNKFGSDGSFAGADTEFDETGYSYGLQFIHPICDISRIALLLRAGALSNHIEVEDKDGDIVADSGHGFGWQIEGGLAIPLSDHWRLLPSLRYRSLSRDIVLETTSTEADLRYLSFGLGISAIF